MTCIVGLVDSGKVYMGGDTIGASAGRYDVQDFVAPKVFANKNMLMGYTTSFRMGQLLEHALHIPLQGDESDLRYLTTTWVDAVRSCFKSAGYLEIEKSQENGGSFLLGYKGHLYMVTNEFSVLEPTNTFASVGCGDFFALGALHVLTTQPNTSTPERKVEIAIEAAARFSGFVSSKMDILSI